MKKIVAWTSLSVFILLMATTISAQKGGNSCVDSPPNYYCVDISPGDYLGYFQVIEFGVDARKGPFLAGEQRLPLKTGSRYSLVIGNEGNAIVLQVAAGGALKVLTPRQGSIRTDAAARKIAFKTTTIKIDPQAYDGSYFLSIFWPNVLFQSDHWCSFRKDQPMRESKVCPGDRSQNSSIVLVKDRKYFLEIYGKGYSAITFEIDDKGEIQNVGDLRSIERPTADRLRFKNIIIEITATALTAENTTDRVKIRGEWETFKPGTMISRVFVPWTLVAMVSHNGGDLQERYMVTARERGPMPTEVTFEYGGKVRRYTSLRFVLPKDISKENQQ